jgi:AcrR family transcriptional regulator
MLNSAVQLLRERGAAGVTVDGVLAHSGAPRGSVYHHFPRGRDELLLGALRQAGDFITGYLESAVATGDVRKMLEKFVAFWKRTLLDSDFRAGCPIVAVAVGSRIDAPEEEALVAQIFATWHDCLVRLLATRDVDPARAARLATLVVAAIEGAVVLCRAQREVTPLDDVLAELCPLIEAA